MNKKENVNLCIEKYVRKKKTKEMRSEKGISTFDYT
jgi:hypothetical protein